jgi:hypothetical protein
MPMWHRATLGSLRGLMREVRALAGDDAAYVPATSTEHFTQLTSSLVPVVMLCRP